jgi:ribosome-associated translation inhibitor RaiA
MKLQVRVGDGVQVSKVLRAHLEGGLVLALGRFGERIERVAVRIAAIDGEQRCRIEVALRARSIRVEGLNGDPFAAVDDAVSRASRSVTRALEREQMLDGYPLVPPTPVKPKTRSQPGGTGRPRRSARR